MAHYQSSQNSAEFLRHMGLFLDPILLHALESRSSRVSTNSNYNITYLWTRSLILFQNFPNSSRILILLGKL